MIRATAAKGSCYIFLRSIHLRVWRFDLIRIFYKLGDYEDVKVFEGNKLNAGCIKLSKSPDRSGDIRVMRIFR